MGRGAGHAGGDISDCAGSAHAVLGSAAEAWEQHAAVAGARGSGGNEENVFAARIDDEGERNGCAQGMVGNRGGNVRKMDGVAAREGIL